MKSIRAFLTILLATLLGCATSPEKIPPGCEVVLEKGDWISVKHPNGAIRIEAGDGSNRIFTWHGRKMSFNQIVRTYRWYGMKGIYSPGASVLIFGDRLLVSNNGITRIVSEEAEAHFSSEERAYDWLTRYESSAINKYVWTSDGLVVNLSLFPSRDQMNLDVIQIYVHNRLPVAIKGAHDNLFHFSIGNRHTKRTSEPNPTSDAHDQQNPSDSSSPPIVRQKNAG